MTASMEFIRKMPLPQEIRRDYPADREIQAAKETRDREISDVLTGKDSRLLPRTGKTPCWNICIAWRKSTGRSGRSC